jgi:malate dehydrogenase (oxaloacetate-decarboxylating)(NADP+)
MDNMYQAALEYHSRLRKGKIEVVATKPCQTQDDLSLAYSPGVGAPCEEIFKDPSLAYDYTAKGNLVAVISNGTAVLGLGNLGPLASKPVMEGKGVLFKRFADIDVFDLEIDCTDIEEFIKTVSHLAPTFGGINLEDIKAPECFEIETRLKEALDIPVFHDDQHGTAIICSAAFLNALEIQEKKIKEVRVVLNGSGASGLSCVKMFLGFGMKAENLIVCDSKGVLYEGRKEGINSYKVPFLRKTDLRTLEEAMVGADVLVGCSVKGAVSKKMVASMADRPIVFAMANPDPEITYEEATSVRDDLIMATGRSDYPNQVNNVMGFPYIFRGALDVQASSINEEMKRAAALAIAKLAKEPVLSSISNAYGGDTFSFGRDYIIPKPFDPRVLFWIAPAVAKAAMDTGVARKELDPATYRDHLKTIFNPSRHVFQEIAEIARSKFPRIVFPEGEHPKIQEAAVILSRRHLAHPILLGNEDKLIKELHKQGLRNGDFSVIDPEKSHDFEKFCQNFTLSRESKGMTLEKAKELFKNCPTYYGSMMVQEGKADTLLSGMNSTYPEAIRPALQIIDKQEGVERVYGLYLMIKGEHVLIFADTTVHIQPTAKQLCEVALLCSSVAKNLQMSPRVAMLSFSQLGHVEHPEGDLMKQATQLVREKDPSIPIIGEVQANFAVSKDLVNEVFPDLGGPANILIFPNLSAGNIAYKLLQELGGFTAIGPILVGLNKSFAVIPQEASSMEVVHLAMAAAAEVDHQ